MEIAVYCGSSNRVPQHFFDVARELGNGLAKGNHTLLYGGGDIGLMGVLARSTHAGGGRVVGVIPEALRSIEGVAYEVADELIVTQTMQERKRTLFMRADAFIALPGGFGTIEEFAEVLTLRKLGFLQQPIVLVNAHGYFDTLLRFVQEMVDIGFSPDQSSLFSVTSDARTAVSILTPSAS